MHVVLSYMCFFFPCNFFYFTTRCKINCHRIIKYGALVQENGIFSHFQSGETTDLGLHLCGLLGIHGQDVLVVTDGVLAVLVLRAHVSSQGLQDAVGLQ